VCGVAELCAATPCLGITDVEVAMIVSLEPARLMIK